jgi:hypothetical protein
VCLLGGKCAHRLHPRDRLFVSLGCASPEEPAQEAFPAAARSCDVRRRVIAAAEVEHEPREVVVPVVVAWDGVDRPWVVLVGAVELVLVLVDPAGRVDDVTEDEQEVAVTALVQQARHERVLRAVALAGVAHHDHRDGACVGVGADREVLPGPAKSADPLTAQVVRGIAEPARELVVPRAPQRQRVDPGEGNIPARQQLVEAAQLRAVPASGARRLARRRNWPRPGGDPHANTICRYDCNAAFIVFSARAVILSIGLTASAPGITKRLTM